MLYCAANENAAREDIERLATAVTDWQLVFDIAARHAIASLVARPLLLSPSAAIPREVKDQFRSAATQSAVRGLRLGSDLVAIMQELERAQIDSIPVKGPTLALLVYGDLSSRAYEDLDILVREKDLHLAVAALASLGYRFRDALTESQRKSLAANAYHVGFQHPSSGTSVELHWLLNHRTLAHSALERRWWTHTQSLTMGGATLETLAPEELLLYLCIHGGKHSWARLSWLCDLERTLDRFPHADWDEIWRAADANGVARMVNTGLALVNELLDGSSLTSTPLAGRREDPMAQQLVRTIRERLVRPGSEWRGVDFRTQLRIRERLRDRVRYAAHVLTAPHHADVALLELPPSMRRAYYILRPARLAWKRLSHRTRNTSVA